MGKSIRIAVVDDHLIFRTGVVQILYDELDFKIVAEGSTAASACDIAEQFKPDVILLDIHAHGSGIEVIPKILQNSPATLIIMLTASESEIKLKMAFDAGARGYVLKGADGAELARAIQNVVSGETYIMPTLAAKLLTSSKAYNSLEVGISHLTPREIEISHSVALGMTNKEIARENSITEKTVKHHMTQIMSKLNVRNRVELALHAINRLTPHTKAGSTHSR